MPTIKVETIITGLLADVTFKLEGTTIQLSYDGNETRKSTDLINVSQDEILNIFFHGVGPVANTGWKIVINQLDPPVANNTTIKTNPIFSKPGKTQSTGHSIVPDRVQL